MANNNITIFDSSFGFENPSCFVRENHFYDEKGDLLRDIRVQSSSDKKIKFNYRQALYRAADHAEEHNILMDFISIPFRDESTLLSFFDHNGFFFQNSDKRFILYSYTSLFLVVQRAKLLIELIGEVVKSDPDLNILINNSLQLALSPEHTIEVETGDGKSSKTVYESPNYKLREYLLSIGVLSSMPEDMNDIGDVSEFVKENESKYFFEQQNYIYTLINELPDYITKPMQDYLDFLEQLLNIYTIVSIDRKDGVNYLMDETKSTSSLNTDLIKKAARYVIKTELDHFTSKIMPNYDADAMIGSWRIPDLVSAIYLSIFFLNPNFQIIKKCANPTCYQYFSVLSSNSKKKYCSQACANAVSQRSYRAKRRQ